MSTILKALRRLEQERAQATGRPLREEVAAAIPGEPLARPRVSRLGVAAAGMAALVLGAGGSVAVVTLWGGSEPAPEATAEAASPPPTVAGAPPESGVSGGGAGATAPATGSANAGAAADAGRRQEAGGFVPEPPPRTAEPARSAAPDVAIARLQDGTTGASASSGSSAGRTAAPEARNRTRTAQPFPSAKPASVPEALSRIPAPDLVVQRTTWHPDADRRSAVVRMNDRVKPLRLREGDLVGPFVVMVIEPSGIVFMRDGELFHRKVGR